jgi:hypothetical protein
VKKALRAAGWRYERPGKGDHETWRNPKTGKHVSVDGKILSRQTAFSRRRGCRSNSNTGAARWKS